MRTGSGFKRDGRLLVLVGLTALSCGSPRRGSTAEPVAGEPADGGFQPGFEAPDVGTPEPPADVAIASPDAPPLLESDVAVEVPDVAAVEPPPDLAGPPPDIPGCVAVPEYCDGKDNDCDGVVDDGVLSPCGDCDPYCGAVSLGAGNLPLGAETVSDKNVVPTPDGGLTLSAQTVALQVIWVANSGEGTVSKLDTATGRELGRYRVCVDPSRTAVSKYGDGWIACRSDNAAVAYVYNYDGDCSDLNQNGLIDTSRDLDADGRILGDELLPQGTDECVRWVSSVGGGSEIARAMGVDFQQHGWAGLWHARQVVRIEPETGAVVQQLGLNASPYGLAIDLQGIVWTVGREQGLIDRVDPATGQVTPHACPVPGCSGYGLTIDEFGRLWMANLGSPPYGVVIFNPNDGSWQSIPVPPRPRGLVADKMGRVFVALDESNSVGVYDTQTLSHVTSLDLGSGRFPLGMAVDSSGVVWAVNQSASSVTRIDAITLQLLGEHPVGTSPYTYSDMTGSAFFDVVQPGLAQFRVHGDKDSGLSGIDPLPNVGWTELRITSTTPGTSHLFARVRSHGDAAALTGLPWSAPLGPLTGPMVTVDLPSALETAGEWLDVELRLIPGELNELPTLQGVDAEFRATP